MKFFDIVVGQHIVVKKVRDIFRKMAGVSDGCNLVAFSYSPLQFQFAEKEQTFMQATKIVTKLLVTKIFNCHYDITDGGPVAILLKEHSKLPREKRLPQIVNNTKWEKYATERRISKKKRDRLEWNDTQQKYVPTWGYQSAKSGIDEQGIIEFKGGRNSEFDSNIIVNILYTVVIHVSFFSQPFLLYFSHNSRKSKSVNTCSKPIKV